MKPVEIMIDEEVLDELIIEDLLCHLEISDEKKIRKACKTLLKFYGHKFEKK